MKPPGSSSCATSTPAQGFEILGISTEGDDLRSDDKAGWAKDKAAIAKFVAQEKVPYPMLVDGDSLSQAYGGLDAMPTSFFVDRKGTVVAAQMGLTSESEIESNIKKALAIAECAQSSIWAEARSIAQGYAMKKRIKSLPRRSWLSGLPLLAHGQNIAQSRSIVKGDAVQYLFPEQVTVPAGKPSPVTLHFRIAQGLHINSHTPREDYLIPTTFSIPDGSGVRLEVPSTPPEPISLCPSTPKPSSASIRANSSSRRASSPAPAITWWKPSSTTRPATRTQCLPPKTIPVAIDVIGK